MSGGPDDKWLPDPDLKRLAGKGVPELEKPSPEGSVLKAMEEL